MDSQLRYEGGWWVGEEITVPAEVVEAWAQVILWPDDPIALAGGTALPS